METITIDKGRFDELLKIEAEMKENKIEKVYDNFFDTLIESAKKNGLEFVDDCGHISVRIKGDKSGKYVRI